MSVFTKVVAVTGAGLLIFFLFNTWRAEPDAEPAVETAPKRKPGIVSTPQLSQKEGHLVEAPSVADAPKTALPLSQQYKHAVAEAESVTNAMRQEFELNEKARTVYVQTVNSKTGTSVKAVVAAPTEDEIKNARGRMAAQLGTLGPYAAKLAFGDAERMFDDFLIFDKKCRVVLFSAASDVANRNDIYHHVVSTDTPDSIYLDEDGDIVGAPLGFSKMKRWPIDSLSPRPRYGHLFSFEEN